MDIKFELSFTEAMQAVLDGKFVQGEHFVWNVYLAAKDIYFLNETTNIRHLLILKQ